ncbi:MAG: RNA-binding protein [bacterium]|jgi:RNA recognition motif-containing protein|nr:RNA-binding protein [candidate division KSB1 bacterium]MCU0643437.1 RNA-binding protein [bacterium]
MNIYIGNLSQEVTDDDLRQAFESFGNITSAKVIKDRFSGESRGFGFIEMPDKQEAMTAMESLNGAELKGKKIMVSEAKPRAEKRRGGSGGGGGRRRSGGGGSGSGGGNRW